MCLEKPFPITTTTTTAQVIPLVKTVYYIHDAGGNVLSIYEKINTTTTLIEVPIYAAGRVTTFKPPLNTYFYEVNDHLGNVRAVIGLPETDTYRTTILVNSD